MEPTVWRDSDGDGVSDFDEIKRFHTNPNLKDSDFDFLNDKEDILAGIYEVEHIYGYARNPAYGSPGRDFDADEKPTELDPDSDNGGCVDGDEDLDKDGFHSGTETGNFDQTDDECGNLQGQVSYVGDVSNSNPGSLIKKVHDEGTIQAKLKGEAPGSDHFVDDGSTFSYLGYARIEIANQSCVMYGREFGTGSGSFTSSDSERSPRRTAMTGRWRSAREPKCPVTPRCVGATSKAAIRSFAGWRFRLASESARRRVNLGGRRTGSIACTSASVPVRRHAKRPPTCRRPASAQFRRPSASSLVVLSRAR